MIVSVHRSEQAKKKEKEQDPSRKRVSDHSRRYIVLLGRDETVCAKSERWSLEKI